MNREFRAANGDELQIVTSDDGARLERLGRLGEWIDHPPVSCPMQVFAELVRVLELLEAMDLLDALKEAEESEAMGISVKD